MVPVGGFPLKGPVLVPRISHRAAIVPSPGSVVVENVEGEVGEGREESGRVLGNGSVAEPFGSVGIGVGTSFGEGGDDSPRIAPVPSVEVPLSDVGSVHVVLLHYILLQRSVLSGCFMMAVHEVLRIPQMD